MPSLRNMSSPFFMDASACYKEQDTDVCIRIGVLLGFIVLTAGLLVARILQYHCYKNKHYVQYFILYTGIVITLIMTVHIVYVSKVQLDFITILLVAVQLLSIWFYYLFWAFRLLKKELLFLYGAIPLVIVLALSFTGVFIWAAASASDESHECTRPQWLIFSTSQLLIVQLFLVTVIYICCKLNRVRTVRINRWSQKAQLIFIVTSYEIVSIMVFVYDVYMIAKTGVNCKTAISHNEGVLVFVQVLLKMLRMLVPQIAIVIIFAPLKPNDLEDGDQVESINRRVYYPVRSYNSTRENLHRDPLSSYPVNHPPSLKPSSPEDHYPSLPRSSPYTPSSGYNFHNFRYSASGTPTIN